MTGRVIGIIERIAALILGLVTLLIFVSVIGRYLFAAPVPDAFDLSRLTLAVAIVWGFASLGFRGNHIKVDLLAQVVGAGVRRVMDVVAWSVLLLFTAGLLWKIGTKVFSSAGEVTMDLRLPHWPFLVAVVLGLVVALLTAGIRIWRVAWMGESLESHESTAPSSAEEHGYD